MATRNRKALSVIRGARTFAMDGMWPLAAMSAENAPSVPKAWTSPFLVGFGAGGIPELAARPTAEKLGERQQVPTIVMNKLALVMVGDDDIGAPLAAAADNHRHLRASTLVVISDAARRTCVEQPAQFDRAGRKHLDAHRPARTS